MHRGNPEDPTEHYVDDDDFFREMDSLVLNHLKKRASSSPRGATSLPEKALSTPLEEDEKENFRPPPPSPDPGDFESLRDFFRRRSFVLRPKVSSDRGDGESDEDEDDFQEKRSRKSKARKTKDRILRKREEIEGHENGNRQSATHSTSKSERTQRKGETSSDRTEHHSRWHRKVGVEVDEALPQLLRVPKDPLPLSWGRTVKPYVNRGEAAVAVEDSQLVREEYITHMDFGKLKRKETYLGVLINPDWAVEDNEAGGDRLQCLRKVPLAKLCPTGFVFIWIEKRDVQNVCDWMYKQNYAYVENLTWVQMLSNNKMVHDESKYMRKSHLTLYIFR